jgi:hypothetical protein
MLLRLVETMKLPLESPGWEEKAAQGGPSKLPGRDKVQEGESVEK